MLRNRPTSWSNAIAHHTGSDRLSRGGELCPISKAILEWMDANPRPITAGEALIGLDASKRWSQGRGDIHRRLTTLARGKYTVIMAGGLFRRGEAAVR